MPSQDRHASARPLSASRSTIFDQVGRVDSDYQIDVLFMLGTLDVLSDESAAPKPKFTGPMDKYLSDRRVEAAVNRAVKSITDNPHFRGGYYQQRLEWRSWLTGRSLAQGLSQRRNAVRTSNIFQLSSPGVFTAKFCLCP